MAAGQKALVIGLDGARGDLIAAAVREGRAPNLARLNSLVPCTSCAGPCARPQSGPDGLPHVLWRTCPGWSSVLTGVDSTRHGVWDNSAASVAHAVDFVRHQQPTFLRPAGGRACAVGRPSVIGVPGGKPGILDAEKPYLHWRAEPVATGHAGEVRNVDFMLRALSAADCPDSSFAHLDGIDQAGHKHGWGSPQQLRAITEVDEQVGRLLDVVAWRARNRGEPWLVVCTADHGGHDKEHGSVRETDSCIPFMGNFAPGPRSRQRLAEGAEPRQFDAATTVCAWMGYPTDLHQGWDWRS